MAKKSKKIAKVEAQFPLFGTLIIADNDKENYLKAISVHCDDYNPELYSGHCGEFIGNGLMVSIGVFDNQVSTLAHECGHAALYICRYYGVKVSAEDSETFCYVLGELLLMTENLVGDVYGEEG